MRILAAAGLALILICGTSAGREDNEVLELFSAYQQGYMQLVAYSCFQLYSSGGIVSTDFLNGYIDSETAREAMDRNRLLLSACTTSLEQIRTLTPQEDQLAHQEFDRLAGLLDALEFFMSAADSFFMDPGPETADAAEAAQASLDAAMESYAGPPADDAGT